MSIFKALKGDSSRISTNITPFNDGCTYFTLDDGAMYVDAMVGNTAKRIKIGASKTINATLLSSGWNNRVQTIYINDIKGEQNGIVSLPHNATNAQIDAVCNAEISVSDQGDGSVTFTCRAGTPKIDIPVVIILFG